MPSVRTIVTVAVIAAATYFAVENVRARGGATGGAVRGLNRIRGAA